MNDPVTPESEPPDELPKPPAGSLICRITVTPLEDPEDNDPEQ